jgi:nitrogen fixation-related uncharacterized protein
MAELLIILGGAFVLVLIGFIVAFVFFWGERNKRDGGNS